VTQNECCTVAVLFLVVGEVMFALKAAISSSTYVTIGTGAASAAELCLADFLRFLRPFSCPSRYDFVVFWYSES